MGTLHDFPKQDEDLGAKIIQTEDGPELVFYTPASRSPVSSDAPHHDAEVIVLASRRK